jgi:hypothetical protein
MRGGTPGAAGIAVILASLVGVALAATGDVVEESRFVKGAEGWTITVDGKGAADGQAQHERGMKRIKGGDTGDVTWYFTAPEKVGFQYLCQKLAQKLLVGPRRGGSVGFLKLLSGYQRAHKWPRIYVYPPVEPKGFPLNRPCVAWAPALCIAILLCSAYPCFICLKHEKHFPRPGSIPPEKHPAISLTHETLFHPQYLGDQRKFYHASLNYTLVPSTSRSLLLPSRRAALQCQ